jgi:hypothetical protein
VKAEGPLVMTNKVGRDQSTPSDGPRPLYPCVGQWTFGSERTVLENSFQTRSDTLMLRVRDLWAKYWQKGATTRRFRHATEGSAFWLRAGEAIELPSPLADAASGRSQARTTRDHTMPGTFKSSRMNSRLPRRGISVIDRLLSGTVISRSSSVNRCNVH